MGLPLSNWNKSHKAVFIAYLSKWICWWVKDIGLSSGRSELASVVSGCEGEAVVELLALRSVFLVWVLTWLTYSQKPRAVLDWLTFKSEFIEASFFHFILEFFFQVLHLFLHGVAHNLTALWLSEITENQCLASLSQNPSLEYTKHTFLGEKMYYAFLLFLLWYCYY